MPGRTPREAVEAYRRTLQLCLSLVSDAVLRANNYEEPGKVAVLTLPQGHATLKAPTALSLQFVQQYKVLRESESGLYKVTTLYYMYTLEDEDGREILGYHWHPQGPSPVGFPHIQLGAGARVGRQELVRAHIPTGRIPFEDFIRLLVEAFQVKPKQSDWLSRLTSAIEKFKKTWSWS